MPPLAAVTLIVLLEALTFGAIFPVLSYYCAELGAQPIWVGILFALVSFPRVVTNPWFGRLSDSYGRRPVLAICTLGTLASSVGWALAPNILWLAASRAVNGISGAQAALAQAVAADVSSPERRAASVGLLGAAFGMALTLGPAIGGGVSHHFSPAAVGWVCAALQAASLAIIALFLRETRPAPACPNEGDQTPAGSNPGPAHPAAVARPGASWRRSRPVMELLLVTLLITLGFSHMNSAYPLTTQHGYGFTEEQTGYALACVGLISAVVQGGGIRVLVARFHERRVCAGGIVTGAAAFVILALHPPLWGFWVATVLLAIGLSLATPCLNSLLSRSASADEQGGVLGANQGVTSLGRAVGVLMAAWLFERSAFAGPFTSAAVLLAIGVAVFAAVRLPAAAEQPGT